jgi:hypothetical protein
MWLIQQPINVMILVRVHDGEEIGLVERRWVGREFEELSITEGIAF